MAYVPRSDALDTRGPIVARGRGTPPRNREQQMIDRFLDRRKDSAYRNGWGDDRFGLVETFLENPNLARWEGHQERLVLPWIPRGAANARGVGTQGLRLIPERKGQRP